MDEEKAFQNKLISLRSDKGETQQEMALKLGVTRTTISKWETGIQIPSLKDLKDIANYFNVPISYLLGEADVKEEKIIVVDTNIFINRPIILEKLIPIFDKIIVPSTVIAELNYQKDNGKANVKKTAWLSMVNIKNECTRDGTNVFLDDSNYIEKKDDERIAASAIRYAKESTRNKVYMFSNDIWFKFLVEKYANIEAITPNDFDIKFPEQDEFDAFLTQEFIIAVQSKDLARIKSFKDSKVKIKKIDVNKADIKTGYTPLIIAIRNRDYEMIDSLLEISTININACDSTKYKFTPLLHTCQTKDIDALKKLINAGADVNAFGKGTNFGNTPLMVCAWGFFNDGLEYLTQFDISYNQQDNNGFTALHKACIKTNLKAVKILLEKVDLRIIDHKGKRAYDYLNATNENAKEIVKVFMGNGLKKEND